MLASEPELSFPYWLQWRVCGVLCLQILFSSMYLQSVFLFAMGKAGGVVLAVWKGMRRVMT